MLVTYYHCNLELDTVSTCGDNSLQPSAWPRSIHSIDVPALLPLPAPVDGSSDDSEEMPGLESPSFDADIESFASTAEVHGDESTDDQEADSMSIS